MRVAIVTLGIDHHYPLGVARMIRDFEKYSPGYKLISWVNCLPFGAPERVMMGGVDFTAYCAKPFAVLSARDAGADIVLWLDASVHAVRSIAPLLDHISATGYYMAPTGFTIGQWASDDCLESFRLERGGVMDKAECASGIVGLDLRQALPRELLERWCAGWHLFPGFHCNVNAEEKKHHYRRESTGHVSADPRCQGHRHDQTVLSILAHQLGLTDWVAWPKFVAYAAGHGGAFANEETCLVIGGPAE